MSVRVFAVVPVKPFHLAKHRLARVLGDGARARLARCMLEDVLDALMRVQRLAGIVVVTGDPQAAALARGCGAIVLDDAVQGINSALERAIAHLSTDGEAAMIVVPSDLPQLTPERIEETIDRLAGTRGIVIVPSSTDGGTNLLGCNPANILAPCFGADSFRRHCEAAKAAAVVTQLLPAAELGLDIDRPEDLSAFTALCTRTRTHAFLSDMKLEVTKTPPIRSEWIDGLSRAPTRWRLPNVTISTRSCRPPRRGATGPTATSSPIRARSSFR